MGIGAIVYLTIGAVLTAIAAIVAWVAGLFRTIGRDWELFAFVGLVIATLWPFVAFVLLAAWLRGTRFD